MRPVVTVATAEVAGRLLRRRVVRSEMGGVGVKMHT